MKCSMIKRKPHPVYSLEYEGKEAKLYKTGQDIRSKRWAIIQNNGGPFYFSSKRGAIHFFKTGEKFKTKPVYLNRGKQQTRIR